MNKDDAQFLCKDCAKYDLCQYYNKRKKDSYICKHFHLILETNRMTLTEFMNERYKYREDKDNIFPVGVSDAEFRAFIIDYLLGKNWYVTDPLGQTQVNEIALYAILERYSKQYKKEYKKEFGIYKR